MVNASLNWASIVGILLSLWGLLATPAGISQVIFYSESINKKEDRSESFVLKLVYRIMQIIGRFLGSIFVGLFLFFQGWRMEPIVQLAISLIVLMYITESANSVLSDYMKWKRNRKK